MTPTLLVTDDSMIIRELIKDVAHQSGWSVAAEASNGQQAIDLYQEVRPAAVTLDLVMPEYDGLHALKGIRALDPDAKVLVISAINQVEVLKEAISSGATDFIVKPFDKNVVAAALQALAPRPTTAN